MNNLSNFSNFELKTTEKIVGGEFEEANGYIAICCEGYWEEFPMEDTIPLFVAPQMTPRRPERTQVKRFLR